MCETECSRFLDSKPHLHQPGPDHEAAPSAEERGEAVPLQTLHQHTHLRRHWYAARLTLAYPSHTSLRARYPVLNWIGSPLLTPGVNSNETVSVV